MGHTAVVVPGRLPTRAVQVAAMDPENLKKIMSKAGKSSAGPAGKAIGAMAGVTAFGFGVYQSLFTVTNGQWAIIFNRFGADRGSTAFPEKGVNRRMVYEEGTHIAIPWFQRPIIYNIKTRPFTVTSRTGSMDLQMVDITIRVLTTYIKTTCVWHEL